MSSAASRLGGAFPPDGDLSSDSSSDNRQPELNSARAIYLTGDRKGAQVDTTTLRRGALGPNCIHVCVDMQCMFADQTDWRLPWMDKVRPIVHRIAAHQPDATIFTRFIPVGRPGEGRGLWREYYQRWASMTLERLGFEMVDLVPELRSLAPPALVVDKTEYSPWMSPRLERVLHERDADTLIITGGETDVCVIATILGAVDRGYRVIVVTDALCSSSDDAHDAALTIYMQRFSEQIETVCAETILAAW
jgi:nicotinamidase-related amidase